MTYFDLYRDEFAQNSRDSEVFLYEPSKSRYYMFHFDDNLSFIGPFSRLMQQNMQPGTGIMHWHIPSVDRSSWLCAATDTSPAGIPEMPHTVIRRNNSSVS